MPGGRPRKEPTGLKPFNFKMSVDLIEQLDQWVEELNATKDGPLWTRSDLIRHVLREAIQRRAAGKTKPR